MTVLSQADRETMALAAKRILNEEVFIAATENYKRSLHDALAVVDATDPVAVQSLQAQVKAIDGLKAKLLEFTYAAPRASVKVV